MSIHPTQRASGEIRPLRRRPRERLAGNAFEMFTRLGGLRPALMPEHLRRQLRILGVSDAQLDTALRRMRTLGDWPYVWESEGDACMAAGDLAGAHAAYYAAQRVLITPSRLKDRLYELARSTYELIEQPQLERIDTRNDRGELVAAYLQLPRGAGPHPAVLMLPGVTGTKEELHAYVMPLLRRGYAVARIDHPVYGETEGLLDHTSVVNAQHTFAALQADARIDGSRIHLHGMSLGAHFALHTALRVDAASITVICPAFDAGEFAANLPTTNLTAIQQMTRFGTLDEVVNFARELSLDERASEITAPARIFLGGRDRTIPATDGLRLARETSGPTAVTLYERDHHNCLEHLDEITAATLEFLDDPIGVCETLASVERRDEAASVQVSDEDARRAEAGHERRLATMGALPLLLRGRRLETRLTNFVRRTRS